MVFVLPALTDREVEVRVSVRLIPEGILLLFSPRVVRYFQLKRSWAANIMNTSVNSNIRKRKTSLVMSIARRIMNKMHLSMKLDTMIVASLNTNFLARVNSFVTWIRS